jgi:hypothetical protein
MLLTFKCGRWEYLLENRYQDSQFHTTLSSDTSANMNALQTRRGRYEDPQEIDN